MKTQAFLELLSILLVKEHSPIYVHIIILLTDVRISFLSDGTRDLGCDPMLLDILHVEKRVHVTR